MLGLVDIKIHVIFQVHILELENSGPAKEFK